MLDSLYKDTDADKVFVQESASVTDPQEVDRLCGEAHEAAEFLKSFVVQAALNERGNFGEYKHDSYQMFPW